MKVRGVDLFGFTTHKSTELAFPDRGLVLIQGENGAGKSSILEGVSYAPWGRTLRGKPPWPTVVAGNRQGHVSLLVPGLDIGRKRSGDTSSTLEWSLVDDGTEEGRALLAARALVPVEWETSTKAQEALERIVGPWDVWRRTHVFRSSDISNFTQATDAERKRLLEAMLGVSCFDEALALCRVDMKLATTAADSARSKCDAAVAQLASARTRLATAEAVVARGKASLPEILPAPKNLAALEESARKGNDAAARLSERRADARAAVASASSDEDRAARRLSAAKLALETEVPTACPTCERAFEDGRVEAALGVLWRQVADAEEVARTTAAALAKARTTLTGALAAATEAEEDRDALYVRRDAAREQVALARENAAVRAKLLKDLQTATADVDAARAEVTRLEVLEEETRIDVTRTVREGAVLAAVETVLGVRGARCGVLARSLVGIEAVANGWLPRFGMPDLRVRLRSTTTRKSGATTDAISIELDGAGDAYGYDAASDGERRRFDLALLLGIAEVAASASGRALGTLWFDEPVDGLSPTGIEAVAGAFAELARDRAVVIITQRADLAARLQPVLSLRVDRGVVSRAA